MNFKKILPLMAVCAGSVALVPGLANAGKPAGAGHQMDRYIIKFYDGKENKGKAAVEKAGGKIKLKLDRHHAIAAAIPAGRLKSLKRNPNVEFIEPDGKRYPVSMIRSAPSGADRIVANEDGDPSAQVKPYGVEMVQADEVTGVPNSGVKVCVIDSGYDINHEDKSGGGEGESEVTGNDDIGGTGPWAEDGSGHGTHVSGTISALDNDIGVIGVFPDVPMHIVRVFGDDGIWAYSSELIDAVDDCIDNDANIISMSLGGDKPYVLENMVFRKAEKEGVMSIAAAGNDGNIRMSYPASYHSVISVAAINSEMQVADFSQKNTHVEMAAPGVSVLSTVPTDSVMDVTFTVAGSDYDAVPMDGFVIPLDDPTNGPVMDCGLGESSEDCIRISDGICLIERGLYSFAQKAMSCENAEGTAAVVYNNEEGALYGTLGDEEVDIPVVGIKQADGQAIKLSGIGENSTLSFTLSGYDYEHFDGTSMAAPHVSAVAALVWSNHPDCSNNDIRNAMNVTAKDLGTPGQDHAYGNGLVQAMDAITYLTTSGCTGY